MNNPIQDLEERTCGKRNVYTFRSARKAVGAEPVTVPVEHGTNNGAHMNNLRLRIANLPLICLAMCVFLMTACDDPTYIGSKPETGSDQNADGSNDGGGSGGGDGSGYVWNNGVLDLGNNVKIELVWIPAGTFVMGSPASETGRQSEETQHTVTISRGFWMGKYEVTQEQWTKVMGSNPSYFQGAQNPVEQVSWDDCQTFVQQLNARVPGGEFRLPTESEWEYACRAGTGTRFYTGNSDSDVERAGWHSGNGGRTTHPVGQKQPNGFGLYDTHGNVWEWCQDRFGTYPRGSVSDPTGPSPFPSVGSERVKRGGSWYYGANECRSAARTFNDPDHRFSGIGLRVVGVVR